MPEFVSLVVAATPLLVAAGKFLLRLLPLVSDRVNKRAVRLQRARNEQKK